MPPCIQYLTKGVIPVYASAWAISASWCGNISSVAPPWRSYCGPKCRMVMAVSSMCHPGRPLPHGLSHAGSPGFCARHRTKSAGCLFRSSIVMRAPGRSASTFCPLSLPQPEGGRVVVHDPVLGDVRVFLLDQSLNLRDDVVDVVRRERIHVHRIAAERVHHLEVLAEVLIDDVPPLASGLLHLLDDPVLDVRDVLQVEQVVPFVAEEARDDVECDVRLRMAHVGLVLRGESADEHRHAVCMERNELLLLPGKRVEDSDGHRAVRMKAAGIKVLE